MIWPPFAFYAETCAAWRQNWERLAAVEGNSELSIDPINIICRRQPEVLSRAKRQSVSVYETCADTHIVNMFVLSGIFLKYQIGSQLCSWGVMSDDLFCAKSLGYELIIPQNWQPVMDILSCPCSCCFSFQVCHAMYLGRGKMAALLQKELGRTIIITKYLSLCVQYRLQCVTALQVFLL